MDKIVWSPGKKPEGMNLISCINLGIPICPECGRILKRYSDESGGCDIFKCVYCGYQVDDMDYEYEDCSGKNNDYDD